MMSGNASSAGGMEVKMHKKIDLQVSLSLTIHDVASIDGERNPILDLLLLLARASGVQVPSEQVQVLEALQNQRDVATDALRALPPARQHKWHRVDPSREAVLAALEANKGHRQRAAGALGINLERLNGLLGQYNIEYPLLALQRPRGERGRFTKAPGGEEQEEAPNT